MTLGFTIADIERLRHQCKEWWMDRHHQLIGGRDCKMRDEIVCPSSDDGAATQLELVQAGDPTMAPPLRRQQTNHIIGAALCIQA